MKDWAHHQGNYEYISKKKKNFLMINGAAKLIYLKEILYVNYEKE
jgi:hypothetical protein